MYNKFLYFKGFLVALVLTIATNMFAQTPLKLYLNCKDECYEDFLKQELTSFSFTRDRFLSDIEVFIIQQESASNGKVFTIELLGRDSVLSNRKSMVTFVTHAADSHDMIREMLLSNIQRGLFKLLIDTPWEENFIVQSIPKEYDSTGVTKDKWNYWVINPGMEGYVEGESNYTFRELRAYLVIRRITRKNKFIITSEYKNYFRRYVLDSTLSLGVNYLSVTPIYGYSVSRHWTLGAIGNYTLDQYRNIHTGLKLAPVLEYNIFPIEMNAKKQLRFAYQAGVQYYHYYHRTVFDYMEETRPFNKLSLITEIVQPWGNISSSLNASAYMDDFSQNRLNLDVVLAFRLFRGFALTVEGNASIINDQISLVGMPLDDTVYLLNGQQLPTTFNFWTAFGFSYTFGSIHNTIVNPRLGRVE